MSKNITRRNMFLTDHIRYILENEALKSLKPQTRAKFLYDQRQKIFDMIEFLKFMLNHLPEGQLEKVFNADAMQPFFKDLLSLESEDKKLRRKRVLSLWRHIIGEATTTDYAQKLVSKEVMDTLIIPIQPSLQAIYLASMFSAQHE